MKLSSVFTALFWSGIFIAMSHAFEGDEEACPAFEGSTNFPSCIDCVESNCGYAKDDGDCVKNCTTVTDTECFSLETYAGSNATEICKMAQDEVVCAAFDGTGGTPTCETCVEAGCGWTADDGDCLESCATVNDGAECVELNDGQTAANVCGSGSDTGTPSDGSPTGTPSDGSPTGTSSGGAMGLSLAYLLVVVAPSLHIMV
jgi:hypothetical protein